MQSKAVRVKDYLAELPAERRQAIEAVRKVILKSLPKGYKEAMVYGMMGYVVPLKTYPKGYLDNPKMPLTYVALASQKNYMALYLINVYTGASVAKWFTEAYKASGKKLDMGKSCIRFKHLEDLPLDVVAKAVALTPVPEFIELYEQGRVSRKK
ncbi:MAG: DUF1801 domain-containing protein [Patescibacteria group bacterium]